MISFSQLVGIHCAVVVLFSAAFWFHLKGGQHIERQAVYFCGLLFILFFPGIGILMAVFVCMVTSPYWMKGKKGLYEDYESYIEERKEQSTYTKLYSNILQELRKEVSFEPFIDILQGGNVSIKKRVIEKLSRDVSRYSIQLLKLAVHDFSPEIRLSAANSLIKMEGNINSKIQAALKMTQKRGAAKDFANLGDLYQMYATSGLMEKRSLEYFVGLACEAYQQSLDLETNQIEVVMEYARSLMKIKNYDRARGFIDHAIKIWPENKQVKLLRGEVYFYLGKFSETIDELGGLSLEGMVPSEKKAVEFWGA